MNEHEQRSSNAGCITRLLLFLLLALLWGGLFLFALRVNLPGLLNSVRFW